MSVLYPHPTKTFSQDNYWGVLNLPQFLSSPSGKYYRYNYAVIFNSVSSQSTRHKALGTSESAHLIIHEGPKQVD